VIVLGGMILQWPVGRLSDMADRRMVVVGTSLVLAAASGGLFSPAGWASKPCWLSPSSLAA
jgi:hypothetical protein